MPLKPPRCGSRLRTVPEPAGRSVPPSFGRGAAVAAPAPVPAVGTGVGAVVASAIGVGGDSAVLQPASQKPAIPVAPRPSARRRLMRRPRTRALRPLVIGPSARDDMAAPLPPLLGALVRLSPVYHPRGCQELQPRCQPWQRAGLAVPSSDPLSRVPATAGRNSELRAVGRLR